MVNNEFPIREEEKLTMETAREVAEKFAESIVSCQLKTKNYLANAIESALTQFADAHIKEAFGNIGNECSKHTAQARQEGFAECQEKAAKIVVCQRDLTLVKALTPDNKYVSPTEEK